MVDSMFASLGTSARDGDDLLDALNSVSLGGAVARQGNWRVRLLAVQGRTRAQFYNKVDVVIT